MNPHPVPLPPPPKYPLSPPPPPPPSDEVPPSYSSLYLSSTNEPLLRPDAANGHVAPMTAAATAPPTAAVRGVHAAAVGAMGAPPSYAASVGYLHHPLPPPLGGDGALLPKWESVPLGGGGRGAGMTMPGGAGGGAMVVGAGGGGRGGGGGPQQYVVVVTSPARESIVKVCCCMPLRGGIVFLAVFKMILISITIFTISYLLSRMSDPSVYEEAYGTFFLISVVRICLDVLLFLATIVLIVCGIVKRRREFFTYYFVLLGIIYTLNIFGTIFVAYSLKSGITYKGGLPFVFDVYFCWKLSRYYNHLGRNAPVAAVTAS